MRGAEGVLLGVDGEVEVKGEEELQLQLVELAQREAADLGPGEEAEWSARGNRGWKSG